MTFGALGDIVKAQAGILESDAQDALRSKLVAAVDPLFTDPAERDWVAASLGVLVGLTDETGAERDGLFTAWLRFLEAVAGDDPLILRVEDLHWPNPPCWTFSSTSWTGRPVCRCSSLRRPARNYTSAPPAGVAGGATP